MSVIYVNSNFKLRRVGCGLLIHSKKYKIRDIQGKVFMSSLVYISRATSVYTDDSKALCNLATLAEKNNANTRLTGILVFSNGYFVQFLEGQEEALVETFQNIRADKRHEDIEMISFEHSDKRLFPDWNMRLVEIREPAANTKRRLDEIRLAFSQNPFMQGIDALEKFIAPC